MYKHHIAWHPMLERFVEQNGDLNFVQLKMGMQIVHTCDTQVERTAFMAGMKCIIEGLELQKRIVELFKN